jgi:ABC-type Mn2+/Zn2+ transport system ATPase subunit
MTDDRKVIILAGPNGAAKTTFARTFLPTEAGVPVFVNGKWQPRLLDEGNNR